MLQSSDKATKADEKFDDWQPFFSFLSLPSLFDRTIERTIATSVSIATIV